MLVGIGLDRSQGSEVQSRLVLGTSQLGRLETPARDPASAFAIRFSCDFGEGRSILGCQKLQNGHALTVYVTIGSSRIVARRLNFPDGKLDKVPASGDDRRQRPPRAVDQVSERVPPSEACTQTLSAIEPITMVGRLTVLEEVRGSSSGEWSTALEVELATDREAG